MAYLDPTDRAILDLLLADARITNREVASRVGVSATTALERTRSLFRRGVITGSAVTVDLAELGRGVQALIAVRIRPPTRDRIEGFRDWILTLPEVLAVFVTSGSEDFLVQVATRDNDALYAFVIDRLTERDDVANVRTSVVFEHLAVAPRAS